MRNSLYVALLVVSFVFIAPSQSEAQLADGTWTARSTFIPSDFPVLVNCFNCPNNEVGIDAQEDESQEINEEILLWSGKDMEAIAYFLPATEQYLVLIVDQDGTVLDRFLLENKLLGTYDGDSTNDFQTLGLESAQGGMSGF